MKSDKIWTVIKIGEWILIKIWINFIRRVGNRTYNCTVCDKVLYKIGELYFDNCRQYS
jgi:hypothetical protein